MDIGWELIHGDARHLPLQDGSIDAIVTDPPYEMGFMGKAWDRSGVAYDPATWREALRVAKPGAHLLAFGGTRTWHRLACAVEDAGFELRDTIAWHYGSGFPKSRDVSKDIDRMAGAAREVVGTTTAGRSSIGRVSRVEHGYRPNLTAFDGGDLPITTPATDDARRWQGWGTALKPAFEPIIVARKRLTGTVAQNVLAHGTGAINIDGCRIGVDLGREPDTGSAYYARRGVPYPTLNSDGSGGMFALGATDRSLKDSGRWPTNVVFSHAPLLDEDGNIVGDACADGCVPGCPVGELDRQSSVTVSNGGSRGGQRQQAFGMGAQPDFKPGYGDTGTVSRFFPTFRYQAKAPSKERPKVNGVAHPTVKPLTLARWLVRLVTPPGGLVLDQFAGSGTTLEAALLEGFRVVGVEKDETYLPHIETRLAKPRQIYVFPDGGV